jgi:hypothetical protein
MTSLEHVICHTVLHKALVWHDISDFQAFLRRPGNVWADKFLSCLWGLDCWHGKFYVHECRSSKTSLHEHVHNNFLFMDVNTPKEFLHECGSRKIFLQEYEYGKIFSSWMLPRQISSSMTVATAKLCSRPTELDRVAYTSAPQLEPLTVLCESSYREVNRAITCVGREDVCRWRGLV